MQNLENITTQPSTEVKTTSDKHAVNVDKLEKATLSGLHKIKKSKHSKKDKKDKDK